MAISIIQSPGTNVASMHTPLWHVVSSTYSALPAFCYIFSVVVDGNTVATVRRYPEGDYLYGVFDASAIVRAYRRNYWKSSAAFISNDTADISVPYTVNYSEEYYDTSTGHTVTLLNVATENSQGYNCAEGLLQFNGTVYDGTTGLITDRNIADIQIPYAPFYDKRLLVPLLIDSSNFMYISCNVNNPTGQVSAGSIFHPATPGNRLIQFCITPGSINDFFFSTSPIVTASTTSIELYLFRGYYDLLGKLIVNFKCNPKYTPYSLHFLNRYGGYETFSFPLSNKLQAAVKGTPFGLSGWGLEFGGMSNTIVNTQRPTTLNYATSTANSIKLTSDWVTEKDKRWLLQLLQSPEVYLEKDGKCYPVTIKTSDWSESLTSTDRIFNFEMEATLKTTTQQFF